MKTIHVVFATALLGFSTASSQQDSLFVTLSGHSVTIWNIGVEANCASRFSFSIAMLDSNGIILTETDTIGPGAKCICTYDLSATVGGLAAGHRTVDVFRQYLTRYHYYPTDTTVHIGSISFDIQASGISSPSQHFYQSPCSGFTSVVEGTERPLGFRLDVNYPNPFNPATVIRYSIPRAEHVTLKVLDLLGREVATLVDERKNPGNYDVSFDANGLPASGAYFYQLTAGSFHQTRKMVLVK